MTISQKCNCCIHEEICSKISSYKVACEKIKEADIEELMKVKGINENLAKKIKEEL